MTRPMTGQPKTDDELAKNTQKANAELSKMLENGEITKGFDDEEEENDEKTRDEKLEELREFKDNNEDLFEDNGKGGQQIAVSDDETKMEVTEDGETETFTREEWENERTARTRVWDRLSRNGGVYVRIARWFNDANVNKVKTGQGFYAEKAGETDKAFKFTVDPGNENHNAEAESVWVPKKAVQVYELKE